LLMLVSKPIWVSVHLSDETAHRNVRRASP
jgi:hypothetical protein